MQDEIPKPNPEETKVGESSFLSSFEIRKMLSKSNVFTPAGAKAVKIWLDRYGPNRSQ